MSSAIAAGYRRGIATIIDANVVTLLTAFILFVLATAGVKGFAFTLGVGTIVSLLTAVVFTQALLSTMGHSRFLRSPAMLGAGPQRARWHFDFMGASRWFFSMSGVILLIGSVSLATKQLNLGIDFESGTRIKAAFAKTTDDNEVRDVLEGAGVDGRRGAAGDRPRLRREHVPDPEQEPSAAARSQETQLGASVQLRNRGRTASRTRASGRHSAKPWPATRRRRSSSRCF